MRSVYRDVKMMRSVYRVAIFAWRRHLPVLNWQHRLKRNSNTCPVVPVFINACQRRCCRPTRCIPWLISHLFIHWTSNFVTKTRWNWICNDAGPTYTTTKFAKPMPNGRCCKILTSINSALVTIPTCTCQITGVSQTNGSMTIPSVFWKQRFGLLCSQKAVPSTKTVILPEVSR